MRDVSLFPIPLGLSHVRDVELSTEFFTTLDSNFAGFVGSVTLCFCFLACIHRILALR